MSDAIEEARQRASKSPQDPTAHYELGRVLYAAGDDRGALAAFDRSLALDESNAHAHFRRALCLVQLEDPEGARVGFERAISIEDGWWHFWYELGQVNARLGQPAEAERALHASIEREKGHAQVHYALGQLLSSSNRAGEAAEQWHQTVAADRQHLDAHYNLGIYYLHGAGNDPIKAADHFAEVVRIGPDDWQGRAKLVQARFRLGHYEQTAGDRQQITALVRAAYERGELEVPEYCIDQFPTGSGATAFVYEYAIPRPPGSSIEIPIAFKIIEGQRIAAILRLESSDYAKEIGRPTLILCRLLPDRSHATLPYTWSAMPPYPELKAAVLEALGPGAPAPLASSKPGQ